MSTWGPELFDSDEDLAFQEDILERADARLHAPGCLRLALEASMAGLVAHAMQSAPREAQVLLYLLMTTGAAVVPECFSQLTTRALEDPDYALAKALAGTTAEVPRAEPLSEDARRLKYLREREEVLDGLKALCRQYDTAGGAPMRLKYRSLREFR